jgi:hypothetical protein
MTWLRVDLVGDMANVLDLDYIRNRKDIKYSVPTRDLHPRIRGAISVLDLCEYNKPLEGVGERLQNKLGQECYFINKKFLDDDLV